jgi:hypothetical protein
MGDVYIEMARRLVAHEVIESKGDERVAATRTLEKVFLELAPLLGGAGVIAIFARSVALAQKDCPSLKGLKIDADSIDALVVQLRQHFKTMPPAAVAKAATTAFAAFIAMTMTMIGERLTLQVLTNAWPATDLTLEQK